MRNMLRWTALLAICAIAGIAIWYARFKKSTPKAGATSGQSELRNSDSGYHSSFTNGDSNLSIRSPALEIPADLLEAIRNRNYSEFVDNADAIIKNGVPRSELDRLWAIVAADPDRVFAAYLVLLYRALGGDTSQMLASVGEGDRTELTAIVLATALDPKRLGFGVGFGLPSDARTLWKALFERPDIVAARQDLLPPPDESDQFGSTKMNWHSVIGANIASSGIVGSRDLLEAAVSHRLPVLPLIAELWKSDTSAWRDAVIPIILGPKENGDLRFQLFLATQSWFSTSDETWIRSVFDATEDPDLSWACYDVMRGIDPNISQVVVTSKLDSLPEDARGKLAWSLATNWTQLPDQGIAAALADFVKNSSGGAGPNRVLWTIGKSQRPAEEKQQILSAALNSQSESVVCAALAVIRQTCPDRIYYSQVESLAEKHNSMRVRDSAREVLRVLVERER